jgi:hypothetical protein
MKTGLLFKLACLLIASMVLLAHLVTEKLQRMERIRVKRK